MPSFGQAAGQVPLCTLAIATLCVVLQAYVFLFDTPLANFTLVSANVIYLGEYYRIISAAVLHSGLMHIVFNMSSFLSIGSGLEKSLGTLALLFTVLWSIILAGIIHVGAEWMMTVWVTNDLQYVNQHSVGFSGVIFTLALMDSHMSTQPTRSFFGMVQVPTRAYPWVLLVALSVFMPGISFVGHLSGILVGVMHAYGVTKPLMPSTAHLIEMESYEWVRNNIGHRHNFVPCPQPLPSASDEIQDSSTIWHRCCGSTLGVVGATRRSLYATVHGIASRIRGRGGGQDGTGFGGTSDGGMPGGGRASRSPSVA